MKLTNFVLKYKKELITLVLIIVVILLLYKFLTRNSEINRIKNLTNKWIKNVTEYNDPLKIYKMFCKDAKLLGTVSSKIRENDEILDYFYYFAKLPGIEVISSKYNIYHIGSNIYTNTALITWKWNNQEPVVARMTFIFKGNCIMQLHSSQLPDPPKELTRLKN